MPRQRFLVLSLLAWLTAAAFAVSAQPAELSVTADFEGGSVRLIAIDQAARRIDVMPGGDPERGWPCWWYFQVQGTTAGESVTVRLRGSTATLDKPGVSLAKPLSPIWAMPAQAAYSHDGQTWLQTEPGVKHEEWISYQLQPTGKAIYVAWGPPYTPTTVTRFVQKMSTEHAAAHAAELCRSRAGRAVPMLHIYEGPRPAGQRFGVWIQARQHAWESGSSWVAQGVGEWLLGDHPDAAWLRQHAEVFLVPIMDIDNTATGNGGKEAQPRDHNRDWIPQPHWNEVQAAQRRVGDLLAQQRMDVFLDLHNPGPGDPTFFFTLNDELLKPEMIKLRDRFIALAYARISQIKPQIPMSNRPVLMGASYHPLWRQISANWVSMNGNSHTVSLCLETIWNHKNCNTTGYRAVGAELAGAVSEYLRERPLHKEP